MEQGRGGKIHPRKKKKKKDDRPIAGSSKRASTADHQTPKEGEKEIKKKTEQLARKTGKSPR